MQGNCGANVDEGKTDGYAEGDEDGVEGDIPAGDDLVNISLC